jgi:hypothetical protein
MKPCVRSPRNSRDVLCSDFCQSLWVCGQDIRPDPSLVITGDDLARWMATVGMKMR